MSIMSIEVGVKTVAQALGFKVLETMPLSSNDTSGVEVYKCTFRDYTFTLKSTNNMSEIMDALEDAVIEFTINNAEEVNDVAKQAIINDVVKNLSDHVSWEDVESSFSSDLEEYAEGIKDQCIDAIKYNV